MHPFLIVLLILLLLAALYLGGGYYVFTVACRRQKELPWADETGLQATIWAPMAACIQESFRWIRDHHAQDVWVSGDDGLGLHGQWIPAENAVGTILLFHGYRSCPQADFSLVLDFYHRLGFHLLLADQRSHGKSQGKYITFGVRESEDVRCWLRWHRETQGEGDVYLAGMSMGATTVLMASGEELPENVRGVIADCGFTSPWDIQCREARKQLPAFLVRPLVWCSGLYARHLAHFGLKEKSTVEAVKKCRVPLLLIHGAGDRFVPCAMSRAAYDACPGEKTLILVEGAGHGQSYVVDRPRCQSALENFLTEHLSGQ